MNLVWTILRGDNLFKNKRRGSILGPLFCYCYKDTVRYICCYGVRKVWELFDYIVEKGRLLEEDEGRNFFVSGMLSVGISASIRCELCSAIRLPPDFHYTLGYQDQRLDDVWGPFQKH
ncbi:hypothetical protein CTI12_AA613910 [Artemisia annua]|uniref:Uncharacterized protein n=1 Tax=Artemisia annua TaxID=35608 RepID=A0A2U1KDX3_ARTAN|nr:hypothetical protein CTI12_AA613910 [Artemisia annua]